MTEPHYAAREDQFSPVTPLGYCGCCEIPHERCSRFDWKEIDVSE